MKIDWKQKLSSRKFWAALAGWAGAMYVVITTPVTEEKIIALVTATGLLCSYIFTEGSIDKANVSPFIDIKDVDIDEEQTE